MLLSKRVPLSECKRGEVYRIFYGKNKSEGESHRLGRVVSVRDTVKEPLSHNTIRYNCIQRSRYLVTMQEPSGTIRCFYAESVAELARRLTWVGRAWNWLRGVRFPA